LLSINVGYNWALDSDLWTSGANKGCVAAYQWCSNARDFENKETRWANGFPVEEENCVYVNIHDHVSPKTSSLGTAMCTEKKRFVCEVIYTHTMIVN